MGYDDVITYLGDFGTYQRRIYFLLCLPAITCAFHKLAGVFLLARPDFRCALPFEVAHNASYADFPETNWSLAYNRTGNTWQTCEYFDVEYTPAYLNGSTRPQTSKMTKCQSYVYDHSKISSSAVIEWNMVCERSLLTATSDALFMTGVLLGSIIFGQLSDKYGRKPTFFAALVIQVVFGVAAGFAPDFITYTLARMIVGSTTSGVFLVAYVIAMELVGVSHRLFAGVAMQMFFSLGFMLTAAFAYFIHDWRWLQIALTLPGLLFLSYYWLIPESVRWMLTHGQRNEAEERLKHAAKVNCVQIPPHVLQELTDESTNGQASTVPQGSVFDLLKYPNLRRKTLLIFFDWFVNSGVYYALSLNTNNLGGNVLVNFVISGAVEIPAYTCLLFTLNRWGRRSILCGCMLLAGVSLLATSIVPDNMKWLIITCNMLGKFAITASYGTIYIFSAEQFPTVVRNAGLGASSMVARIGSILAPYLNLLNAYWAPLPLVVCGALAFLGGMLSLLLPETLNKPMLETIADSENFGKRKRHTNADDFTADLELRDKLHKHSGEA